MSAVTETQYEANKAFRMLGRDYLPGDPVDVSELQEHKVSQFLNQRILRPARVGPEQTKR